MAITELEITSRTSFASGQSFGDVGAYELLEGTAHYAVDPTHPRNHGITDLDLAPRNTAGQVEFSSDFAMLQPVNIERGNRRILFDVVNRGRKTALSLNSVPTPNDPTSPLEAGNGYLMRRGYTVVWGGWQADVPPSPGLIGLHAPEAISPQGPLTGKIMCQFQCNEPTQVFLLADRQHLPNPATDPEEAEATLTVRDLPNSPATPVDRGAWSFVRVEDADLEPQHSHIYMPSGFEPGKIYQLVYTTTGSRSRGPGFRCHAGCRLLPETRATPHPGIPAPAPLTTLTLWAVPRADAFCASTFTWGSTTTRMTGRRWTESSPTSRAVCAASSTSASGSPPRTCATSFRRCSPLPTPRRPDPVTGAQGSLLDTLERRNSVPKIMFTNTSAEYWRGDAALIHTDLETLIRRALSRPAVRRYHFRRLPARLRRVSPDRDSGKRRDQRPTPLQQRGLRSPCCAPLWTISTAGSRPAKNHPPAGIPASTMERPWNRTRCLNGLPSCPPFGCPAQTTRAVRLELRPGGSPGAHHQAARRRG